MVSVTVLYITQMLLQGTSREAPMSTVTVNCLDNCMLRYLFSSNEVMIVRYDRLVCTVIMIFSLVQSHCIQFILNLRVENYVLTTTSDLNYAFSSVICNLFLFAPFPH